MRLYGYGEDVLTLCALSRNFDDLLTALHDDSQPSACQVFYRPSFGRRGGEERAEFGEFDFVVLSPKNLYLGESKWDRSSEKIEDGVLRLQPEQIRRHEAFKRYIDHWAYGNYADWEEFREKAQSLMDKPIPEAETRLAANLQTVLGVIKEHFGSRPAILDVLLYFHEADARGQPPVRASDGFELVCIDCSAAMRGNFVTFVM